MRRHRAELPVQHGRACRAGTSRPPGRAARARRTACCARARPARRPSTTCARGRVVEHHVGRLAHRERPAVAGQPPDPGGRVGHPLGDAGPVEQAGVDHRLLHHRQRGLQPEHPEGRRLPLAVLVLVRVRRVVGGDDVDGAVGQAGAQRLDVGGRAQRRVDLVDRVVRRSELVGQQQVVRADLGGDVPALRSWPSGRSPPSRPSTRGRRAAGSRRGRRAGSRGR